MVKKLIIVASVIIIPVIAAIFGFQFGAKQITVSAAEPQEEIKLPETDASNNGFSDAEEMLRNIVWKNVGLKETVHAFEYTSENALYVETGFNSVEKDLKKVLKLLKDVKEKCGEVVGHFSITFNGSGSKKMMSLEFNNEILGSLDFTNIKSSDLMNLATTTYLDDSLNNIEE